jgi:DNA-binding beta-propeller fold protein YncE
MAQGFLQGLQHPSADLPTARASWVSSSAVSFPVGVAYDSGKGEIFVANSDSDTLSVISYSASTSVSQTVTSAQSSTTTTVTSTHTVTGPTTTVTGPSTTVTSPSTTTATQTSTSTVTQTSSVVPGWAYGAMVVLLIAGLVIGYSVKRPSTRQT